MKYRGTEPNCSLYVHRGCAVQLTAVTMYVRSLFFLVVLTVENVGAKGVVTFNPNWNKIFTGESLNMTCHVDSTVEDVIYQWFKDSYLIYSGKTFTISSAQAANSGNYQCQTAAGERSDSTRLEVHNGYVILQTSLYVYEGDNLTLRCHHHPGYLAKQTIFYKNNDVIKHWGHEDELHIENVDMKSNAKYKCTKQVNHHLLYYQHTDETSVSVQELFSLPTIKPSPYSVMEGDHMALTCHTTLSPLRQTTVLQFAFYRDGQKIQEFSSSNKYEIQSVKQHDAGDYNCEIMTSNYRIKKMSTMLTMQVSRNSQQELFNHSETEVMSKTGGSHFITAVSVTSLVLVLVLVGTGLIFLYKTKHFLPVNQSPKAEVEERDEETENIYTEADISNRWQNLSQNPQKSDVTDLVKENHFVLC